MHAKRSDNQMESSAHGWSGPFWGVSKGGFLQGGLISIIEIVRAPVAITNFASFVRELLIESYKNSESFDAKLIIATGARAAPIIEISLPSQKPPFGNP